MNNSWIQTYTGLKFFLSNPSPESIVIEDIAHSLSLLCRYNGHIEEFYSVAQHSVYVSIFCDPKYALQGLLHDASEAYLSDIPSPFKRDDEFSSYRDVEKKIQTIIYEKFHCPIIEDASVKEADRRMLETEINNLHRVRHPDWQTTSEPYNLSFKNLLPKDAKKLFMNRFLELTYK